MSRDLQHTLAELPDEWPDDPVPHIQAHISQAQTSLVVLDDDPTGTQTVYDIPVLTQWSVPQIKTQFDLGTPLFFILTNSRRLHQQDAVRLAKEIGVNLQKAAAESGRQFRVISRSDSTLRGHFPAEVDALAESLNMNAALRIVMPFFHEGGRFTIADIHYVRSGDRLVPAGETEFATDPSFSYQSSNLRDWIMEKTRGSISADEITSITLEEIRTKGPGSVAKRLLKTDARVCVVNAVSRRDAEVVALALIEAGRQGLQYICRSAASLVAALAGLYPRPLLRKADLMLPDGGGSLTVVGSHVPSSTRQLERLLENSNITPLQLEVGKLLSVGDDIDQANKLIGDIDGGLKNGEDVVLYTSRNLIAGNDPDSSLDIAQRVSACLVRTVSGIHHRPRYIVAKGGITSSDIATLGLSTKQALVLGQILPGVPVWRLGSDSKFGEMIYVVFPGNVGEPDAMSRVVTMLSSPSETARIRQSHP